MWRTHDAAIADEHALALLVVILGVGLVLRTLQLDVPMQGAEALDGASARGVLRTGLPLLPTGLLDLRTPLFHWLLGGAFALGGDSLLSGRLFGLAGGVLAIGGVYLLGWRLFRSRAVGLVAALLLAVDPFSVAATARMGSIGLLQLGTVAALTSVEHQWLGRGADRAPWKLTSALAVGVAALAHPLFLAVVPALIAVVLIGRAARRVGGRRPRVWRRALVPLVVVGAVVALLPIGLIALAAHRAELAGVLRWSGGAATTLSAIAATKASWWELTQLHLRTFGPLSGSGVAATSLVLLLTAACVVVLAQTPGRARPAMRLVACAAGTVLVLGLWPDHRADPAFGAHVAPMVLLMVAAAIWPFSQESLSRRSLAWAGAAALGATIASAAWLAPLGPLGGARHALLALPLVAGGALAFGEWRALPRKPAAARLRGALLGGALALVVVLNVGLVKIGDPGWHEAGLAVAPTLTETDRLVVHGAHAPTVWWSTGRVDAVVPAWDLLYAVDRDGQPYDAVTGARVADDRAHLSELVGDAPVRYLTAPLAPPPTADPAWVDRVEAPLDAWVRERLPVERAIGPVELRAGRLAEGSP